MNHVTPFEFFRALYPDPVQPGHLALCTRTFRGGKERTSWCCTLREMVRLMQMYRNTRLMHFGVALQDPARALRIARSRRKRATRGMVRGTSATVTALPALWIEIALAPPGATPLCKTVLSKTVLSKTVLSKTVPGTTPLCNTVPGTLPDRQAALSLLDAVPQPPSIVVSTGASLCVYWLLNELWVLETEADRAQAKALLRRVQWAIEQRAATLGWWIAPDADLARALRAPGTLGTRPLAGRTDRLATLERFPLTADEGRYPRQDFDDLPEPPPLAARTWQDAVRSLPVAALTETNIPADFRAVWDGCPWFRACHEDSNSLPKSQWEDAVSVACRCEAPGVDGRSLAHGLSQAHPGYSPFATDEQLTHELRSPRGARSCREIAAAGGGTVGDDHCRQCPHFGHLRSPLDLGRPDGPEPPASPAAASAPALAQTAPTQPQPAEKPVILVTAHEKEVNNQALVVLASKASLFEREGQLVEIQRPRGPAAMPALRVVREARLQELLAEHCTFVTHQRDNTQQIVHPPRWTTRALLARGSWPELPLLAGVVESPLSSPSSSPEPQPTAGVSA